MLHNFLCRIRFYYYIKNQIKFGLGNVAVKILKFQIYIQIGTLFKQIFVQSGSKYEFMCKKEKYDNSIIYLLYCA